MFYVLMNIALYIIEVSDIFLNLNDSEMVTHRKSYRDAFVHRSNSA